MRFMNKLKRTLRFEAETLKKYIFLEALGIILFILVLLNFNIIYLITLIIFLIILLINSKALFIAELCLILIVFLNIGIRKLLYKKKYLTDVAFKAVVINCEKTTNSNKILIKKGLYKYIYYEANNKFSPGDIIYIKGVITPQSKEHIPMMFNYQKYLEVNNILGVINVESVKFIKKGFTLYSFNYYLKNYFTHHFSKTSCAFLEALLIGVKNDIDDDALQNISYVGISHLFVISGLHMGVLSLIIKKLLGIFKLKEKIVNRVIILFFIIYFIITRFSISILRVLLVFILGLYNKNKKLNLSSFNIFCLSALLLLVVSPYLLLSYAFVLTYLTSTSLVLISPLLKAKKIKGFILNNLLISLNSLLCTIPIVININPTINLLLIIYNLFFIPFVTYIILPLSFITAFVPFLSGIYEFIINLFLNILKALSKINFLNITFSSTSIFIKVAYYLLYILIILFILNHQFKRLKIPLSLFTITLFIWNNSAWFNNLDEVYFLDLPKGEATLICSAFDRCNILIDTGENSGTDLEIFLKKKGIKRLDYVFISHGDSDHVCKLKTLILNFKIKNIALTKYDKTTLEICKKNSFSGNIIYFLENSELRRKNIYIKCLSPNKNYQSRNDNSMVLYVNFKGLKMLFTGDATKNIEDALIKKYQHIDVDILKVPHHGSLTSSSDSLLRMTSFKYAICMNGYYNTFSFPNPKIKEKYHDKCFLVTSENNTIIFRKNGLRVLFKLLSNGIIFIYISNSVFFN